MTKKLFVGNLPYATSEEQLRMRTHLAEWDDDVPRLERSRGRLGEEWRVEHEVLGRENRRAAPLKVASDVAPSEPAAEDQSPAACLASFHTSCLPRWRSRCR